MIKPVEGARISQRWGANPRIYQHFGVPYHNGTDYAAPLLTPIRAVLPGVLVYEGVDSHPSGGYGIYRRLYHPGYDVFTFYAHLVDVGPPQVEYEAGDTIGLVGNTGNSTGPHLHFEVRLGISGYDGPAVDARYGVSPYEGMSKGRINPETILIWEEHCVRYYRELRETTSGDEEIVGEGDNGTRPDEDEDGGAEVVERQEDSAIEEGLGE